MLDDYIAKSVIDNIKNGDTGLLSESQLVTEFIDLKEIFCDSSTEAECNAAIDLYKYYRSKKSKTRYDADSLNRKYLEIKKKFNELSSTSVLSTHSIPTHKTESKCLNYSEGIVKSNAYFDCILNNISDTEEAVVAIYTELVERKSHKKRTTFDSGLQALKLSLDGLSYTNESKNYLYHLYRNLWGTLSSNRKDFFDRGFQIKESKQGESVLVLSSTICAISAIYPNCMELLSDELQMDNDRNPIGIAVLLYKIGFDRQSDLQSLIVTLSREIHRVL